MKLYNISADGGNTWTTQWLREHEVEEHKQLGYIVEERIRMRYGFKVDGDALRCRICGTNVAACKTETGWILSSSSEGDEGMGICHECLVEHCCNTNCFGCDWYKYPNCPHIETKKIYMEEI